MLEFLMYIEVYLTLPSQYIFLKLSIHDNCLSITIIQSFYLKNGTSFICNGHCCQTQAVKRQFKGKVTSRSR